MGFGETISLIAVMAPLVVVLAAAPAMYSRRLGFKQRKLELEAQRGAELGASAAAQIDRLEQRVRVLERIATDRKGIAGATLAAQIESLREPLLAEPGEPR